MKSILNVLGVLLCMWLLSTGHSVLYHNIQYTEYAIDENRVLVMRECEYILDVLGVIYQKDGYWLKELKKVMQNGEISRADYPAQKGFYPAKEGYFWVESVEGTW